MVKLLTNEEAERIRQAIHSVEMSTAGQIRVSIVRRSSRLHPVAWAFLAVVIGLLFYAGRDRAEWGHPSAWDVSASSAIGAVGGAFLVWIGSLLRTGSTVQRRAEHEFVRLGMARTSGRTGILLLLSVSERRAVLLADQGIHGKVDEGTWERIVDELVSTLRKGRRADGLVEAVGRIGLVLAKHVPRSPEDQNELPDDVALDG
jgi:putative membrane protein